MDGNRWLHALHAVGWSCASAFVLWVAMQPAVPAKVAHWPPLALEALNATLLVYSAWCAARALRAARKAGRGRELFERLPPFIAHASPTGWRDLDSLALSRMDRWIREQYAIGLYTWDLMTRKERHAARDAYWTGDPWAGVEEAKRRAADRLLDDPPPYERNP